MLSGAAVIAELVKAHVSGDDEKFMICAKFVADALETQGKMREAKAIRDSLTDSKKNSEELVLRWEIEKKKKEKAGEKRSARPETESQSFRKAEEGKTSSRRSQETPKCESCMHGYVDRKTGEWTCGIPHGSREHCNGRYAFDLEREVLKRATDC